MEPPATAASPPVSPSRALGNYGERLAARYLIDEGFVILDRNWRCVRGEIDIVALDGACLVVVEVKTRSTEAFGAPFEAVTRLKLARLHRLATLWRQAADPRWAGAQTRIDVVSILRPQTGPTRITHLRSVE